MHSRQYTSSYIIPQLDEPEWYGVNSTNLGTLTYLMVKVWKKVFVCYGQMLFEFLKIFKGYFTNVLESISIRDHEEDDKI